MTTAYIRWGRPRNSWHLVTGWSDTETICGRRPIGRFESTDTLPAARSCESCLRIARRRTDIEA